MTSALNLEEIYSELNILLKDVCNFLKSEVQKGTLSSLAQNEAEKLVARSQKQVEVISTISTMQENIGYPYLEMQGRNIKSESLSEYVNADNASNQYDIYEESYDQVDTNHAELITVPPIVPIEEICPFSELSIENVTKRAIKSGPLYRKERYLLFGKKQYFVALIDYWLMIFGSNKKDTKALLTVHLSNYTAQMVDQKKDPIFEIVAENKKTYEFLARSSKDMQQWIVAINHKKQKISNIRNLPDIPLNSSNNNDLTNHIVNNNTTIHSMSDEFGSEGDIYEKVEDLQIEHKTQKIPTHINDDDTDTPTLPPRQPNYLQPSSKSESSNAFYNNVTVDKNQEENIDDEDESEAFYDELNEPPTNQHGFTKKTLLNYDIPRVDQMTADEELPEYDELKMPDSITSQSKCYNFEDEYLENYDELKIEETIIKPPPRRNLFKINKKIDNTSLIFDDDEEENYDELKPPEKIIPIAKIPSIKITKIQPSKSSFVDNNELEDYDELKEPETIIPPYKKSSTNKIPEDDNEEYDALIIKPENSTFSRKPVIKVTKKTDSKLSKAQITDEEEFEEYDEIKIQVTSVEQKTVIKNDDDYMKYKPVTSPKPKLTAKLPSFSRKISDTDKKQQESSKIHGIIQQMEASLLFKGSKN